MEHSPEELWTYLAVGPFNGPAGLHGHRRGCGRCTTTRARAARDLAAADGRPVGPGGVPAARRGATAASRSARIAFVGRAAAHHGRDRGDVPDGAPRLRRPRLPALRVEVRRPQRAVAARPRGSGSATRAPSAMRSVYKGRNRDTAWFSIIDADWPEVRRRRSRPGSTRRTSTPTGAQRRAGRG